MSISSIPNTSSIQGMSARQSRSVSISVVGDEHGNVGDRHTVVSSNLMSSMWFGMKAELTLHRW